MGLTRPPSRPRKTFTGPRAVSIYIMTLYRGLVFGTIACISRPPGTPTPSGKHCATLRRRHRQRHRHLSAIIFASCVSPAIHRCCFEKSPFPRSNWLSPGFPCLGADHEFDLSRRNTSTFCGVISAPSQVSRTRQNVKYDVIPRHIPWLLHKKTVFN